MNVSKVSAEPFNLELFQYWTTVSISHWSRPHTPPQIGSPSHAGIDPLCPLHHVGGCVLARCLAQEGPATAQTPADDTQVTQKYLSIWIHLDPFGYIGINLDSLGSIGTIISIRNHWNHWIH